LAIDKEAFRRAARPKPDFSFTQGAAVFEKHGLGTLDSWTAAGPASNASPACSTALI